MIVIGLVGVMLVGFYFGSFVYGLIFVLIGYFWWILVQVWCFYKWFSNFSVLDQVF